MFPLINDFDGNESFQFALFNEFGGHIVCSFFQETICRSVRLDSAAVLEIWRFNWLRTVGKSLTNSSSRLWPELRISCPPPPQIFTVCHRFPFRQTPMEIFSHTKWPPAKTGFSPTFLSPIFLFVWVCCLWSLHSPPSTRSALSRSPYLP